MVGRGANPVLYLAEESKVACAGDEHEDRRGLFWEGLLREIIPDLQTLMGRSTSGIVNGVNLIRMRSFLMTELLPLIKPFSTDLEEDDPQNYYMEREWRMSGALNFSLADVTRVVLPRAYGQRFREDFPDYYGQVSFPDGASS